MQRSVKLFWIALAVLVPLGLFWQFYPLADASSRLDRFSLSSSGLSSPMELAPDEMTAFSRVRVLKRLGTVGSERAVLTVIDGTRNRHAIHDPEFCFRGAGWEIGSRQVVPLSHGAGLLVSLRRGNEIAQAMYWFSDGERQFDSPFLYWWKTSLRRVTFGHSGQEPVLVVLSSTETLPNWTLLLKGWTQLQDL